MLKNLKVGVRLAAGFVIMIGFLAVIMFFSISRLNILSQSVEKLVGDRFPKVIYINDAIDQVNNIAQSMRNLLLVNTAGAMQTEENKIRVAREKTVKIIENFDAIIKMEAGRKLMAAVQVERAKIVAAQDLMIPMVAEGRTVEMTAMLLGEYQDLQDAYIKAWYDFLQYQMKIVEDEGAATRVLNAQSLQLLYIIGGVSVLLAILLALLITNSIVKPLSVCITAAEHIAQGDIDVELSVAGKDELAQLQRSMVGVVDALRALIAESGRLTTAAVEGRLATRGEAAKFQGGYRGIVEGVNNTLEALIGPLNVTADYVDRISKGDIPPKITDNYNGDFNLIKNNLNAAVEAVNSLVADADMLAQAAVEGRLQTRADAEKHHGDYKKIVQGVNRTLDLVITPVNEVIAILKRMAEGDLIVSMTGDYKGDFDVLKTALNDTINSMNDTLGQVAQAVEQVTAGSQQVSQASQALSQGATEQASSLEEITSSVTQISGQTRQNTDSSVRVNSLAAEARDSASAGDGQMKDLVLAMADVNKSAEEIRKIVKAIDDISFQINLLALNANVEAARAGKYGKGFAVVAEEVRNLAVRSATSVKETTSMVDEVIKNIGKGNALVDVTAKQLGTIVTGVTQVAGLAEEVATASREQSQGLEQITQGLTQIDQVTQSNTASAEESASAAEELSSQAQQLKGMVGRFKLKVDQRSGASWRGGEEPAPRYADQGRSPAGAGAGAKPRALALHRDELAKHAAPAGAGAKRLVNPADIISLDDDDFGKF